MKPKTALNWVAALSFVALGLGSPPSASAASPPIVINPDSLRELILKRNLAVIQQAITLNQAKAAVQVSRGNLLPSLNVTTVIFDSSSPLFLLNTVEVLIPFIIPTNWFNYANAKYLYLFQKEAGQLVELNQYLAAYSLYYTILNDEGLVEVIRQQYESLEKLSKVFQEQYSSFGSISPSDLQQVAVRLNGAKAALDGAEQSLTTDMVTLKSLLNIPLNEGLQIEAHPLDDSPWEGKSIDQILAEVIRIAPEWRQADYGIKAAKENVRAQEFAVVTGASATASAPTSAQALTKQELSGLSGNLTFGLGFSTRPAVRFAKWSEKTAEVQKESVYNQQQLVVETTMGQLAMAVDRVDAGRKSEDAARKTYDDFRNQYEFGNTTLKNVLDQHFVWMDTSAKRMSSELLLNLLRITLHRVLLTDRFAGLDGKSLEKLVSLSDRKRR